MGGTEATVLRVTCTLSRRVRVVHFQNGRTEAETTGAGLLRPLAEAFAPMAGTTFVVINAWKVACKLRKAHPLARVLLWLHIHPGRHNRPMGAALRQAGIGVICVSRSHADGLRAFLGTGPLPAIRHIHNPVADDLTPDETPRDPDRLLFASAPHKGLREVFAQFRAVRAAIPGLTLAVADPGYLAWDTGPVPEGVTVLGPLPHPALIAQMRRALCLFYPQTSFAETFGLVLAEANAVGTPVLVHQGLGANDEVAGDPAQRVNGHDTAALIARLDLWRRDPPTVAADPRFRLTAVVTQWADALHLDAVARVSSRKVA